jgi:uncharacterized delta-60 repeat protein
VRLGPHGGLDGTFSGDGVLVVGFGRAFQGFAAVAFAANGEIVAGGYTSTGTNARWALARVTDAGTLDASFGGDGRATTDLSNSNEQIYDLAIQPNGRIVAAGVAEVGLVPRFAVSRYRQDGSRDPTFSGDGSVRIDVAAGPDTGYGVAIQRDARIVVVGNSSDSGRESWGLVRLRPHGALDATFDGNGLAVIRFTPGYDFATEVVVQRSGRLLVVGRASDDLAVVRLNANGARNRSFGRDGRVRVDFSRETDTARDAALAPRGRLDVAGEATFRGTLRFAVVRLSLA